MSASQATVASYGASKQAIAEAWHPKRGIRWGTIARHAVLIILCLWVILPLLWVVGLSFKSLPDGTQRYIWPKHWVEPLDTHYQYVLNKPRAVGPVWSNFKNSVFVTALTVIASTITAVFAGYALTHLKTPGKSIIAGMFVCSMFFPTQVTAIIGIYHIQDKLGFVNKTWTLMFPYTALTVALSAFIMRGVFQSVPAEIVDSSKVDGASSFRTLVGIMLPIIRNGVVVVIIVNFVASWGEYLLAKTLMNDQDHRTLPVFLGDASGGVGALLWPRMAALYILAILPALITFAVAQRWYMKGLQEGALKG